MSNLTDFRRSTPAVLLGTTYNALAIGGVTISSNAAATDGWVLVATSSNSAIWRNALAFGSNTNDVSSVGTMGASSSNTRADHVHRGVRSLSHTSNTFFGDVTLTTPGDNVAITSPASGTLALGLKAIPDELRAVNGITLGASSRIANVGAGNFLRTYGDWSVLGILYADGSALFGGAIHLQGIQASTITGTNDNVSMAASTNVFRWAGASAATITGFTGVAIGGRTHLIVNASVTDTLTLAHDTGSTAANRFYCPGSVNYVLSANGTVTIWYDITSSRWRIAT